MNFFSFFNYLNREVFTQDASYLPDTDSPEYRRKVISKLELYMEYGIYPNQNLITTYETAENPLDAAKIEAVLNQYFL